MLPLAVGDGSDASIPCMPSARVTQEVGELLRLAQLCAYMTGIKHAAARPQHAAHTRRWLQAMYVLPRSDAAKTCDPIKEPMTCMAVFTVEAPPDRSICSSSDTHLLQSA
mmetsp:Transcript_705/g.1881  ORF Transcript_705/g.1881 Transcript_705/m.1881 type:complete len:110 (+) Transcript_705:152-481(+)